MEGTQARREGGREGRKGEWKMQIALEMAKFIAEVGAARPVVRPGQCLDPVATTARGNFHGFERFACFRFSRSEYVTGSHCPSGYAAGIVNLVLRRISKFDVRVSSYIVKLECTSCFDPSPGFIHLSLSCRMIWELKCYS